MPRIAVIERDGCLKEKCHVCIKVCPVNRMGQPCIVADAEKYPVIDENLCTGCGICPKKCPTKVITIINLVSEAGELIHQYGVNAFRLYNLPIPREGVVGFVGENGIGKTTALSILSGGTVPNFGDFGKSHKPEESIKHFKGKESANYFQRMLNGITVAYKIQNVESLRSSSSTRDFLGGAVKLATELGLGASLDKKVSDLSGGELQMVAIAKTASQKADFYFFDEPCSYLDVRQRLVAASVVRELAEQGKIVIVVEHDLAVLDYLTDYVYIFYGEKGTYGVVSNLKSSRAGVNEYLDGFLREENIRLRKEQIVFDVRGMSEFVAGPALFDYPSLGKVFPGFSLSAQAGEIREGEIIGVVGPNPTGKTTFIKMLAGAENPDKGAIAERMRVSYKPQYITAPSGTVSEVIGQFELDATAFDEMRKHLGVDELMEKECSRLSGGELQRLAIALALSQDADIYLLDEPSAFLDIEQRISLAGILKRRIREGKVAFVVDHDIVFIDAISDRIVVFAGKSGVSGEASAPMTKRSGMNRFLAEMGITLRRDKETLRPRINKAGSVLDREQKEAGEYYYV